MTRRPTTKQLDRMETGFKFVGLDLCTHNPQAGRYRYHLDAWNEAPGPILAHDGECPRGVGDGLCVALTVPAAQSGGQRMGNSVMLLTGFLPEDVLGRGGGKARVRRLFVDPDPVDPVQLTLWAIATGDLRHADLRGAYLRSADLRGAYLRGAYLRGAYLRGADLGSADLGGADLGSADLGGAYLGSADLRGAYLGSADLGGAYLGSADLGGADLRGAYLGSADLRGAYLGSATGNERTRLPVGYRVNDSGLIVQDGAS